MTMESSQSVKSHIQKDFFTENRDSGRYSFENNKLPDAVLVYIFKFTVKDYLSITLTCRLFNNSMKSDLYSRADIMISSCEKTTKIFKFAKSTYENTELKESTYKEMVFKKCIQKIWDKRNVRSSNVPQRILKLSRMLKNKEKIQIYLLNLLEKNNEDNTTLLKFFSKNKNILKLILVRQEKFKLKVNFFKEFINPLIFKKEKEEESSLETTDQDKKRLFLECKEKAEMGDPNSQFDLGELYWYGRGVEFDSKKAFDWYKMAAVQKHRKANHEVGYLYMLGTYLEKQEGYKWFKIAADQGCLNSQYKLGLIHYRGIGVPQSTTEGYKWLKLSADQGCLSAQYKLGLIHYRGIGVPQSTTEAHKWFKLSADQGCLSAQYKLGIIYYQGIGVPQSITEAHKWLKLAAYQGHSHAQDSLKKMCEDVPVNKEEEKNLKLAADNGDFLSQYNILCKQMSWLDEDKLIEWLEIAFEKASGLVCNEDKMIRSTWGEDASANFF